MRGAGRGLGRLGVRAGRGAPTLFPISWHSLANLVASAFRRKNRRLHAPETHVQLEASPLLPPPALRGYPPAGLALGSVCVETGAAQAAAESQERRGCAAGARSRRRSLGSH